MYVYNNLKKKLKNNKIGILVDFADINGLTASIT